MNTPFDPRAFTPHPDELAGRVIAITGPTRGIGRAVALACATHGANVVLVGRNVKRLEAVHAEIAAAGGAEASIAPFDLEKALASDYDTLASALLERYGRLDGLLQVLARRVRAREKDILANGAFEQKVVLQHYPELSPVTIELYL